ncbi:VOC family protein [Patescibacteria group bacterium]|nr:VOC family protein [Patescibacteria group bacterium]
MKFLSLPTLIVVLCAGLIMISIMAATDVIDLQRFFNGDESATSTLQNEYPQPAKLAEKLQMGVVELNVADLAAQQKYYQELVGLEVLSEDSSSVTLGFRDRAVIRLVASPQLPPQVQGSAGLYHSAIVFSSRATLAQAVQRILERAPQYYSGTSDHVVSEAFYFVDPEGNGVELYYDKDPASWRWRGGSVEMGSEYIDPEQYIKTYANTSAGEEKKMGHVHLKVGDIEQAKSFYESVLGLAVTSQMPTALFMSDGKYHHYLGMNVWESPRAGMRTPSLGLKSFEIFVPDAERLTELKARLTAASISFTETDKKVEVEDPWGTVVLITVNEAVFSE